jgi:hypothetical protein
MMTVVPVQQTPQWTASHGLSLEAAKCKRGTLLRTRKSTRFCQNCTTLVSFFPSACVCHLAGNHHASSELVGFAMSTYVLPFLCAPT